MDHQHEESQPAEWLQRQAVRLGVPVDFLLDIGTERDHWAFVVKIHALVETSLTDIFVRHIGQPGLDRELRRMPLSKKRAWAEKMQLLQAAQLDFIEALTALRNDVVHDVATIPTFNLRTAVAALNPSLRMKLLANKWHEGDPRMFKFGIWIFAMIVLVECEKTDINRAAAVASEEDRRFAARASRMDAMAQAELQRQLLGDSSDDESS